MLPTTTIIIMCRASYHIGFGLESYPVIFLPIKVFMRKKKSVIIWCCDAFHVVLEGLPFPLFFYMRTFSIFDEVRHFFVTVDSNTQTYKKGNMPSAVWLARACARTIFIA
mmetsp:Transcript_37996/g.55723  ORF Transcript_37996/g.55723 Transcript_37996/m.55723 type:complete len:110 (-) Transcript_37996:535-864(-)